MVLFLQLLGAIFGSIVAMEQQGAIEFFHANQAFDVEDLLQTRGGKGVVNRFESCRYSKRQPQLFCMFMLSLLQEIYMTFSRRRRQRKPKLVLFIDAVAF